MPKDLYHHIVNAKSGAELPCSVYCGDVVLHLGDVEIIASVAEVRVNPHHLQLVMVTVTRSRGA